MSTRYKTLEEAAKASGRHLDGYQFILEGLQHTVRRLNFKDKRRRHVKAAQLLEGLSEYAIQKFGLLATTVFHEWGIKCNDDIGDMVYQMIDLGIMRRSPTDKKEDFSKGADIYEQLQQFASQEFTSDSTRQE